MTIGLKSLAYLFRTSNKPRPVLLLGAGTSSRSGVPLADAAVRHIAQKAFARSRFGREVADVSVMPSDYMPLLQSQTWFIRDQARFSENFPLAVENLLIPSEFRRDFFQEMIRVPGPSQGYKSLSKMMAKRLIGTVLTTNFDCLIADALREQVPKPPQVTEIRTSEDIVMFGLQNSHQIVYLHGSVEHYQDKNLKEETERLDEKLANKVRPLLSDSPLIVIGYRGAEPSVMHHLLGGSIEGRLGFRNGLFWCVRKTDQLHPNVISLQATLKSNFQFVEIEGFDELMVGLDKELESESWYTGSVGLSVTISTAPQMAQSRFDLEPLEDKTLDDLNIDLILSTLAEYCRRLNLPEINHHNYLLFLEGQGFLHRRDGRVVPSRGCFLLFGAEVQKKFPHAVVSFVQGEKNRTVIQGNLITQFRQLLALLSTEEVNPRVRLKTERAAEEQNAFPVRALTELTVNMLVHRDYQAAEYSRIDSKRGHSLVFENPGGLMPEIKKQIRTDGQGRFEPIRGLTEMRNPLLADIFYGLGPMDKQGSGLADVKVLALESGGKIECSVREQNRALRVSLFQPLQESPESSPVAVATRVSKTEVFVTNLLPFRILPDSVFFLPLRGRYTNAPIFDPGDESREIPIVIAHGGFLISFSDFKSFPEFASKRGFLNAVSIKSRLEMVQDRERRNLFVWLLNKHWDFFLRRKLLAVEPRRKRAFFKLTSSDRTSIAYLSKMNRRVSRDVVKRRGEEPRIYFENEAIHYEIAEFFGEWALQIRPTYVFTKQDGMTPLSPIVQTRRATRRFRFDRNPAVDNDLVFWSRYLSDGQPTISIGNIGATNLVLDSDYVSAEVPKIDEEEGDKR